MTGPEPKPAERCVECGHLRSRHTAIWNGTSTVSTTSCDAGAERFCCPCVRFVSRSAAETAKADTPNSEAPTAGIGAAPATPASAVQSSAAENECAACRESDKAEADPNLVLYDRLENDRRYHDALIARLRAENRRLRELLGRIADPSLDFDIEREARRALAATEEPSG